MGMTLTTHFHLMSRLGMNRVIPPLPHMTTRGTQRQLFFSLTFRPPLRCKWGLRSSGMLRSVNWKLVAEVSRLLGPRRLDRWVAPKRRLLPTNERCITCQKSEVLNLTVTYNFNSNAGRKLGRMLAVTQFITEHLWTNSNKAASKQLSVWQQICRAHKRDSLHFDLKLREYSLSGALV
jgi:hypothetical protein